MNDLQIKNIDFYGGEILGVKTQEGKIYMGVRKACRDIGLTEDQAKRQIKNIQADLVLSKGVSNLTLPTNGGIQEVLGIEIGFIPLWLAKISITPKMQKENPETVKRLVKYQLEAKEVLEKVFIEKKQIIPNDLSPQLQFLINMELKQKELETAVTETKEEVQAIRDTIVINPKAKWRKDTNRILNIIGRQLDDYQSPRNEAYEALKERANCRPNVLVNNLKKRALNNGMAPSKVEKLCLLDVLEIEPRLKEIYVTIVKEMAIKNGVPLR